MTSNKNYGAGLVGGLVGGMVFGMIMTMMGMMPMVAALVKSNSVAVGWIVHLILSVIIGLFYAWWFGGKTSSYGSGAGYGLLHGFIWWILGPLIIMPVLLGMGVKLGSAFAKGNMLSLMGHLIFGLVLGLTYFGMAKK